MMPLLLSLESKLDGILLSKPNSPSQSKAKNDYMMADQQKDEKGYKSATSDTFSIPTAHPVYEKQMQKYEDLQRKYMKTEFQMKVYMDNLQEKLDNANQ